MYTEPMIVSASNVLSHVCFTPHDLGALVTFMNKVLIRLINAQIYNMEVPGSGAGSGPD